MVQLGRNVSTGKLLRGSDGKLCRKCCGFDSGVPSIEPCPACPSGTTPTQILVSLSDFEDKCSDCVGLYGIERRKFDIIDISLADIINGDHILTQVGGEYGEGDPNPDCMWTKIIPSAGILRKTGAVAAFCGITECGYGNPQEYDIEDIQINIYKHASMGGSEVLLSISVHATGYYALGHAAYFVGAATDSPYTQTTTCFHTIGPWFMVGFTTGFILTEGTVGIEA